MGQQESSLPRGRVGPWSQAILHLLVLSPLGTGNIPVFLLHSTSWKTILCWRWSLWPMPPIPMSNQHVKRGYVFDPIFFNLCWLRSLSLPGWMIGLEPWSPEIDKIEQWTTPRAWHSQHWGCDFCTWFAWFAGTGKAEGTIYFMAALHWLYIGSTWSTSSTDSSQDSFGSQTTNNS